MRTTWSTTGITAVGRRGGRRRTPAELTRTGLLTTLYLGILLVFLSPLAYSFLTSVKTEAQMSQANSPILPSDPRTFEWDGESYDVYFVPMPDGAIRELALVKKGRQNSDFIDPANPDAGVIAWQGSWRSLAQPWEISPHFENYIDVWNAIDFPRHLGNTLILAIVTTFGTVLSCTLVAYGFARFRFPGGRRSSRWSCRRSSCRLPSR